MYRAPSSPDPCEAPPRELTYEPLDRKRTATRSLQAIQLLALPLVTSAITAAMFGGTAGLGGLLASSLGVGWWWRRKDRGHGVVLRIEGGIFYVLASGSDHVVAHFRLADLTDVVLDSKTIQRVMEGGSAIPAVRFLDSTVGPEVQTSRVVLLASGERPRLTLGEAYLAHMDATEWLGKIRVFLRGHGWVPADERDTDDDEE